MSGGIYILLTKACKTSCLATVKIKSSLLPINCDEQKLTKPAIGLDDIKLAIPNKECHINYLSYSSSIWQAAAKAIKFPWQPLAAAEI